MPTNPNLQGLNIIQLPSSSSGSSSSDNLDLLYPGDSSQDHQLALWSNLHFDTDELPKDDPSGDWEHGKEKQRDLEKTPLTAARLHGSPYGYPLPPQQPQLDINALLGLAGGVFGPQQDSSHNGPALSLAQLISLANALPQANNQAAPPPPPSSSHPPAKRARTTSVSSAKTPTAENTTSSSAAPATPAEEKRRRNTAASARFRLKKKEREAALEGKAKELEVRVSELERECEGLRRENGWLRGLVVGVTQSGTTNANANANGKRPREEGA